MTRVPLPSAQLHLTAIGLALALAILSVTTSARGVADGSQPPGRVVIDHRAVSEFGRLDERQIEAAAARRFMLRTASIGWGIGRGLDCLMNNFPGRKRRPYACDKGVPAGQVVYGSQYDRRNWMFEVRGNPGWYGKVSDFVRRLDDSRGSDELDVVGFNLNYGDGVTGSDILTRFFSRTAGARMENVSALEALETRHPDKVFVWWTMALPRQSSTTMQQLNERLRAYARERNKNLFDLADIESHRADGGACVDNHAGSLEAICEEYTDERNSGHLNARGSQRVAKAIWVLMARLAEQVR